MKRRETFSNLLCEPGPIPKPNKDIPREENYKLLPLMNNRCKIPQHNISKQNPTAYQKDYTP